MYSNYPDDIRQYDKDPRSPFYEEVYDEDGELMDDDSEDDDEGEHYE